MTTILDHNEGDDSPTEPDDDGEGKRRKKGGKKAKPIEGQDENAEEAGKAVRALQALSSGGNYERAVSEPRKP